QDSDQEPDANAPQPVADRKVGARGHTTSFLDRPGRPLKEGAGPPPLAGRRPASDTIRRPDAASPLMRSARWPSEMRCSCWPWVFKRLIDSSPSIASKMLKVMAQRLRASSRDPRQ